MTRPRLAAIILARLDSSRFPGKALRELASVAIIEHVLRRLERCEVFDDIVLATTSRKCDDALAEYFIAAGGTVYRATNDEVHNVAKRFVSAAQSVGATVAMRANGDSPFPDRWLIEQGVAALTDEPDLVTNLLPRSYPYGISVELVKVAILERELASLDAAQTEHVTAVFYAEPGRFRIATVPLCPWDPCPMRLTVDEPGDLTQLEQLVSCLEAPVLEADMPSIIEAAMKLKNAQRSKS
jgi:spore coat polysaccharide biosynthesis protein SpsF